MSVRFGFQSIGKFELFIWRRGMVRGPLADWLRE